MQHAMYDELAPWYALLDPADDHADEVAAYVAALSEAMGRVPSTLLELGSGAGNNAVHVPRGVSLTLVDPADAMLNLSRAQNPAARHVLGDMRTVRLAETFDAVLLHDAVVYMTNECDLRAALETVFVHTAPGGAALIAPDVFAETFEEATDTHVANGDGRSLRCVEWMHDPDPNDTTYTVDYAFLVRDEDGVRAVHDRHVEGLFSSASWERWIAEAGFEVRRVPRPIGDGAFDEVFVAVRPRIG